MCFSAQARDSLIFSISHEIPMGYPGEKPKKNYYVNIGSNQGVEEGSILAVFRNLSRENPYNNKNRVNYRVKIGELNVIHSEGDSAITELKSIKDGEHDPYFEVEGFMIGDYVSVKIDD